MEFTEVGVDPSKGVQYYHSEGEKSDVKIKDLATNTLYENVIFLNIEYFENNFC